MIRAKRTQGGRIRIEPSIIGAWAIPPQFPTPLPQDHGARPAASCAGCCGFSALDRHRRGHSPPRRPDSRGAVCEPGPPVEPDPRPACRALPCFRRGNRFLPHRGHSHHRPRIGAEIGSARRPARDDPGSRRHLPARGTPPDAPPREHHPAPSRPRPRRHPPGRALGPDRRDLREVVALAGRDTLPPFPAGPLHGDLSVEDGRFRLALSSAPPLEGTWSFRTAAIDFEEASGLIRTRSPGL